MKIVAYIDYISYLRTEYVTKSISWTSKTIELSA